MKSKVIFKCAVIVSTIILFGAVTALTLHALSTNQFQYAGAATSVRVLAKSIDYREYKSLSRVENTYPAQCWQSVNSKGESVLNIQSKNLKERYNLTLKYNIENSTLYGFLEEMSTHKFYALNEANDLTLHKLANYVNMNMRFVYLKSGQYAEKYIGLNDVSLACDKDMSRRVQLAATPQAVYNAGITNGTILSDTTGMLNITRYLDEPSGSIQVENSVIVHLALAMCKFYYMPNGDYLIEFTAQSIFNLVNYNLQMEYSPYVSQPQITSSLKYKDDANNTSPELTKSSTIKVDKYTEENISLNYLTPNSVYVDLYTSYFDEQAGHVAIYSTIDCTN